LDTGRFVFILVAEGKKAGHVDSSIDWKLSQFYGLSTNLGENFAEGDYNLCVRSRWLPCANRIGTL
jgi:hypothetical protein